MNEDTLPSIENVIAHRGTMLLLDRLLESGPEICVAEYTPRADAWYADAAGKMPAWIGMELMAQVIAAQAGLAKRAFGAPPKQGVLLGTRSYKSAVPAFVAGTALRIVARLSFRDDSGLAAYDCSILAAVTKGDEAPLASATLKVFEPDDFQAFLKGSFE